MKTAIMTDTNSGISVKEGKKLGVFVIPMPILIDEKIYFESINITEKDFFDALNSGKKVSTSQPSPGEVIKMWNFILENGYEEIVYIPMSSGLSHSCEIAQTLAMDYEGKIQIVNNHRISATQRESVLAALDLTRKNKTALEIKNQLEKDAYHASIYISLTTLEFLKKGGRITPLAATIGTAFSIKPILTIQGEKLDAYSKVRGSIKKCTKEMIKALKKDINERFSNEDLSNYQVDIAGAGLTQDEIDTVSSIVSDAFPNKEIFYSPLAASICCHTGQGAIGVGITF